MRFVPGEVPEILVKGQGKPKFVPVKHPFAVEQVIAEIAEGKQYNYQRQMVVGGRLVKKRSLRGIAERAMSFWVGSDEDTQ